MGVIAVSSGSLLGGIQDGNVGIGGDVGAQVPGLSGNWMHS